MLEPVLSNHWVRAVGVLLAIALVAFLAYLLSPVLIPLFLAFLVAYTLDPLVDKLEARGLSRTRSIAVFAGIGLVILLAIPAFVVPSVIHQAQTLGERAEGRIDQSEEGAEPEESFVYRFVPVERLRSLVEYLEIAPAEEEDYDPVAVLIAEGSNRVRDQLLGYVSTHGGEVAAAGQTAGIGAAQVLSSVGRWLIGAVLFLANFALFSFVAVYLLRDYDNIVATSKELVPPRYRLKTFDIGSKINAQIRGFIRGQMMVCLALGALYAIGLSIAGVPFAILIGIFGGIASFIPYLGLILTIIPSVVLCLLDNQGLSWHFFAVLATFGTAQFLEGTFITPKLVGDQVGLGPVWVILAVLVFGSAMGFLGLLLAVPIAATLKVLIVEALGYYRSSSLYQEAEDGGG